MNQQKYGFKNYLLATPFEANRNFSKKLTPEIFFKELFITSNKFTSLVSDISKALIDDPFEDNYQVVFLDGYRGVGKTTLLRHFDYANKNYKFTFLDFYRDDKSKDKKKSQDKNIESQNNIEGISLNDIKNGDSNEVEKVNSVDPFKLNTIFYLESQNHNLDEFISFLIEKKSDLHKYFYEITDIFLSLDKNKKGLFYQILDKSLPQDAFRIFLLYLVRQKIIRNQQIDQENISYDFIILDNLDSTGLANITSFVKEDFAQILESFQSILQDSSVFSDEERELIDFDNTFKFIFCLRDSNKALINNHINERLNQISTTLNISNFESALYDEALQQRLKYYLENKKNSYSKEVGTIVQNLRDLSHEKFFSSIIAPLFNWNFRETANVTYESIKKLILAEKAEGWEDTRLGLFDKKNASISKQGKYGKFGAIFFHVISKLRNRDFLKNYPFGDVNRDVLEKNGYCVPLRVILTVLLNVSNVSSVSDILELGKQCEDVKVVDLYEELKDVIDIDVFSSNISEMFNFHQKGWGHLITCRRDSVENKKFVQKIIEEKNEDILIALNPAGFVCLRSVLTHFEFYSVLFNVSQLPLFQLGLRKDKHDRYIFENVIDMVVRKVQTHCKLMKIFYTKHFVEKKQMDENQYLTSKFAFKHFGFYESNNQMGMFHATRLVSFHIKYIDNFRIWILKNTYEEQRVKFMINKKLIDYIEKYLQILKEWKGLREFQNNLSRKINYAKETKYVDYSTSIVD